MYYSRAYAAAAATPLSNYSIEDVQKILNDPKMRGRIVSNPDAVKAEQEGRLQDYIQQQQQQVPKSGCFLGLPKIKNSCYILPGVTVAMIILLFLFMRRR